MPLINNNPPVITGPIIVNFFVTDGFDTVPHSLIVNVTGLNDAAVITGIAVGEVTEDAVTTAAGSLSVSDVDAGQAAFQAVTGWQGSMAVCP